MPKKKKPSSNGNAGRTIKGQFAQGNKLGKGNLGNTSLPARELKKALLAAVTDEDIEEIVRKLLSLAKEGEIPAIKELFDRLWGRAKQEVDFGENTIKSIVDILAVVGINNVS